MYKSNKEGSGLFIVIIILTALSFGIYSVFDLINGELRLNKRAVVYNEARQAVESLLQASLADFETRFSVSPNIDLNTLITNPFQVNQDWLDIYTADGSRSNLVSDIDPQFIEIMGGQVTQPQWVTINSLEPGYETDFEGDKLVFRRTTEVIAKATVDHPSFGPMTAYASQHLEIRDIPLFAYAIFYNMPMEIAPGQLMNVYGNVHVNGDAWFQSKRGLNFHDKVTITGNLYHGRRDETGGIVGTATGAVNIANFFGELVNMRRGNTWPSDALENYSANWLISSEDNFFETSKIVWSDNLQTGDYNVVTQNLPGVEDYNEGTNDQIRRNSAYPIIQPVSNEIVVPSPSSPDYQRLKDLQEMEKQKFAYKASLTIEVDTDTNTLNYFTYQRDSNNDIIYSDGMPVRVPLNPPEDIIASIETYSEDEGNIVGGLRDIRQEVDVNIVNVDIAELRTLVHDGTAAEWGGPEPSDWWDGIVYVQFPQGAADPDRSDNVIPAASRDWGVKLTNGEIIPNPSFPDSDSDAGTTIATNQMMYVEGNYNADGDSNTGSPTEPDSDNFGARGSDAEAPAALIADAITFLSENWDDANSDAALGQRTASDTEVSAAIMTGVVPSGKDGQNSYSGGVENLPRFLENWGSKTFTIRGSMVALFESEVATERWGKRDLDVAVYSPPQRAWGFHSRFGRGELPPGTPFSRVYRGRLQMLTEDQYALRRAGIPNGQTSWRFDD